MRDDGGLTRGGAGKGTHFRGGTTGRGDDLYLTLIYPYCSGTHVLPVCSRSILGTLFSEYTYYE